MIVLFGRESCIACQDRKKDLLKNKIPFKYFDIDTTDGLAELCFRGLYVDNLSLPIESRDDLVHISFE